MSSDNIIRTRTVTSPVGELTLAARNERLIAVLWENELRTILPDSRVNVEAGVDSVLDETAAQLNGYFAGERQVFDLPLQPEGTPFQLDAWLALRAIPYAETRSYAYQAAAIGRPKAVRAIGAANGRNPLSIIVPCHRVVGSNGALTGFAGGVDAKRWLLNHECRVIGASEASRISQHSLF